MTEDELAALGAKWANPPWYHGDDYGRLSDEARVAVLDLIAEVRRLRAALVEERVRAEYGVMDITADDHDRALAREALIADGLLPK